MLPRVFTSDQIEFFELLNEEGVEFLLVGGLAVNYYGYSRSTGDMDLFYRADRENVGRLYRALGDFFGGGIPGIAEPEELLEPGLIFQFGLPPHRVDLLNEISGVKFEDAWSCRVLETVEGEDAEVPIIDLQNLLKNKRASARPKDEDDFQYLSDLYKEEL